MNIYLGNKGLNQSWQAPFEENTQCYKCAGNARIMFVGAENERGEKQEFICDLYENMKDGKYWVHDAMAVAVYLCEKCFTPIAIINQA